MEQEINRSLDHLIQVFKNLLEHVQEITLLESKKNKALMNFNLDKINEIIDEEEEQEAYYDELEKMRNDEIQKLSDYYGFDVGISLEYMIEYFPEEYQETFRVLRKELIRKKNALDELLKDNMALIEDSFQT